MSGIVNTFWGLNDPGAIIAGAFLGALIAVWAIFFAASTPAIRWSNPNVDEAQFLKDRYECLQQAEQRVSGAYIGAYGGVANSQMVPSCGVWTSCMGARGYVVEPNGPFVAPPGMGVACR